MLKRTLFSTSLLASSLLLSGHAAEASMPEFGTVTAGPPFFGAEHPTSPGASQPTVHVARENDTWTRVEAGNLIVPITYTAHMEKGYIIDFNFGRLSGLGSDPVNPIVSPIGEPNPNMADTNVAGLYRLAMKTVDFSPGEREQMVAACTSRANEANSFEVTYNFLVGFEVDAKRRRRWTINGYVSFGDFKRTVVSAVIPIRVICEPPSYHVAEPLVPFKVTGAELYLATFKGNGPIPAQGASCKVLRVTARFKTTTGGLVRFDFSNKVGDQPLGTTPITIEAKKKSDGTYAAEYVKDWFLDKTTYAQFLVQETNGQGLSAGWKDIKVSCGNFAG